MKDIFVRLMEYIPAILGGTNIDETIILFKLQGMYLCLQSVDNCRSLIGQ